MGKALWLLGAFLKSFPVVLAVRQMRDGIKEAASENVLSPRFYTTDFEEMERLFGGDWNSRLNKEEMDAILQEFRYDYNQKHFVRNDTFRAAADNVRGPARKIFIEFLERSCTAEFSGFLLYKELGRRLKSINPVVAEVFTLMSRDEARHAGFLNKAMSGECQLTAAWCTIAPGSTIVTSVAQNSHQPRFCPADFDLALDLGFLTKNRQYTFFAVRPSTQRIMRSDLFNDGRDSWGLAARC